jgi:hypothetical protein
MCQEINYLYMAAQYIIRMSSVSSETEDLCIHVRASHWPLDWPAAAGLQAVMNRCNVGQ